MYNLFTVLFINALLLFTSCEEEVIPPIKPPIKNNNGLDTVWTKIIPAYNKNIISRISINPILTENKVIVSNYDLFSTEWEVVSCFDKMNGNLYWSWNDYINVSNGEASLGSTSSDYNVYNNVLNFPSDFGNYFIDANTGMTLSLFEFKSERNLYGEPSSGFSYFNENIFRVCDKNSNPSDYQSTIYISSAAQPELRPIFSYHKGEGFESNIDKPCIYVNQSNDTLLVFSISSIKKVVDRTDVMCYNMSKRNVEWAHKDIVDNLPTNNYPTIEQDRFYFITQYYVHCYNILTGEKIWRYAIPDFDGVYSSFVVENGKMYFGTGSGIIYCLDSRTGKLIWKFDSMGSENRLASPKQIKIFEDKLYYCDGRLAILDSKKGEMLHFYKSPYYYDKRYPDAFFDGINIDPVSRLMYLTDGHFLICARIPK